MNAALVCIVAMPVLPLLSYFFLSFLGVSSMCKVVIPEIFTIAYVILVVIVVVKKIADTEKDKKEQ
ncbi:hypothetical protein NECID01_1591 [Nematocida sp. AWRm77]|nr:hypothetical protein NECID01_1591 [Nematocida sp. AWRm77]